MNDQLYQDRIVALAKAKTGAGKLADHVAQFLVRRAATAELGGHAGLKGAVLAQRLVIFRNE